MKTKLFDNPVKILRGEEIKEGVVGIQKIYRYPNGYGASIIRTATTIGGKPFTISYTSNENEWELAVIKFNSEDNDRDFEICYDTEITNDVMGHLTTKDVEKILRQIKKLKVV